MVQRIGGFRRKTRGKLTKANKGRIVIRKFLQEFEAGESIGLKLDSSFHQGIFHPRFHGKTGTVLKKEGKVYHVSITDGGKKKTLLVHPIHMVKHE